MDLRHTHRLFVTAQLAPGQTFAVSEAQAHHLLHVLRLTPGAIVRLFNDKDGEFRGEIARADKKAVTVAVSERLRAPDAGEDVWLCPAPIKQAHFDYMIEKATELGVSEIQPVLTQRTQVRAVNADRLYKICVESAEQSERLSVPAVGLPVSLDDLIAAFPQDRVAIICAEHGEAQPVHEALQSSILKDLPRAAIITGPEGGFAIEELDKLRALPNAHFVRLGPRILRADTAAIAALTCWQAIHGDWSTSG